MQTADAGIFQAILDPILLVQEDGVIVDCNAAAVRFIGVAGPQEVIGRRMGDFSSPPPDGGEPARETALRHLRQTLESGSQRAEVVFYAPYGSVRTLDVASSRLDGPDTNLVLVHWHDISEWRQKDEELRQLTATLEQRVHERTAELEAANVKLAQALQHKDKFLATVSHELRTPLTGILSFAQALEEAVYGALPERQRQVVQLIRQAGEHLLRLINGILDLARLQMDDLHLNRERAVVDSLCRLSLRVLDQTNCEPPHSVIYTIDRPEVTIEADKQRIVQMLSHLLSNAAKFTPPGGSIALEAQSDLGARRLTLSVSDTGIGIDPADLPHLFQPFVQLDASLARHYQGAGIGLALVRAIAELHGGSVGVESARGVGSRFWVTLPLA